MTGKTESRISIRGRSLPVRLRRNARARRLTLRLDRSVAEGLVITLPPGLSERDALAFARLQERWILDHLDRRPAAVPFAEGARLPVLGVTRQVCRLPGRGVTHLTDEAVWVAGRPEHLSRRLSDWLRAEARRRILPLVAEKTARHGLRPGRITVRDTRSRWGSCATNGNLSFSWRLVLAPPMVLDYVVAHEVAHLRHHDHSAAFWALAADLSDDMAGGRAWLKAHGAGLHRYG